MLERTDTGWGLVGPAGRLDLPEADPILIKLGMLYAVCCAGHSVTATAHDYGYSRQRLYQLLTAFRTQGLDALRAHKRGPHGPSRRPPATVHEIIRHRFLDPEASPAVIAQKLRQTGVAVSIRSVERTLQEYGLQKKTLGLRAQPGGRPGDHRDPLHQNRDARPRDRCPRV
jgi:transposase